MDGKVLEDLCVAYLQRHRGYTETYYDDDNVRMKLGLAGRTACKCADILSLRQPERLGVTEVTIAEAKASRSASPDDIAEQLGTAAAAAFRLFGPRLTVNLVLFTDRLIWANDLMPHTRTPVHVVTHYQLLRHHRFAPTLYDPVARTFVKPRMDERQEGRLGSFAQAISTLPIEVVVASQLAEKASTAVRGM